MNQIQKHAVLAALSIATFATKKSDKKLSKELTDSHGADADAATVSKRILSEDATEEIKAIVSEARTYHAENTIPGLYDGARMLPTRHLDTYTAKMRDFKTRFEKAARTFVDNYPAAVADAAAG
ncbi:MAG: hypothetical protein HC888_19945 [Candidatus Competibacteraceae bacterium]|nr:hypothetical protein [Candidatus Competibacteraceae bacterium]